MLQVKITPHFFYVHRDVKGVCGFTREVLTAVVSDIETREWRRSELKRLNLPPEHPRACSTDDVECFFSIICDLVGIDFTLKQVQYEWRKVCVEYQKRSDPNLPYYYFTASHDRFYEGTRPCFNEPKDKSVSSRVPRRESLSFFTSSRATLPVRGTQLTRAKFHNLQVDLPPPPSMPVNSAEHSYSRS